VPAAFACTNTIIYSRASAEGFSETARAYRVRGRASLPQNRGRHPQIGVGEPTEAALGPTA